MPPRSDTGRAGKFIQASLALVCVEPADNKLNQRWLDYWNFAEEAPTLNFYTGNNLGLGLAHTVKIQMSPDPARPNSATVRNCSFTSKQNSMLRKVERDMRCSRSKTPLHTYACTLGIGGWLLIPFQPPP